MLMREICIPTSAGYPLPPLTGAMDQARFWASYADRDELRAWVLASFEAMDRADQLAFLSYVQGGETVIEQ